MKYSESEDKIYHHNFPGTLPDDIEDIENDVYFQKACEVILYSASKNGFYDHNFTIQQLPEDVCSITKEMHNQLLEDQSNGKSISSDVNGSPQASDKVPYEGLGQSDRAAAKLNDYLARLEDENIDQDPDQAMLDDLNVPQLKELKSKQAFKRYTHAMNWVTGKYPDIEKLGWSEQRQGAELWAKYHTDNPDITDQDAEFDSFETIKELAKGYYGKTDSALSVEDMDSYAGRIRSKASEYHKYYGGLTGIEAKIRETVEGIPDDFSNLPMPEQAEADARAELLAIDSNDILGAGYAFLFPE